MVIFSAKHKLSKKEFIGGTMDGGKNDYNGPIEKELINIMRNNIVPDLSKDLKMYGLRAFDIKPLAFPGSLTTAMVQEKLHINSRKTMAPNGYNTCYVFEKVLNA